MAVKALALLAPPMPMAPFFDIQTKKPMISRTGRNMAGQRPTGDALRMGSVVNGMAAAWSSRTSSLPNWFGYEVWNYVARVERELQHPVVVVDGGLVDPVFSELP